jgi:glyoxylase-like metal-dependent hydrolase (beta-lactamase superfamily II)
MNTIQFVNEGLGNSSYLLDLGNDQGVLIDPDRSVERYLVALRDHGLRLTGVLETHLHADFVSGARELAARTGSAIFLAADAHSKLPVQPLRDGQTLQLNGARVTALGSPGHTPEHLSFAIEAAAGPPLLFSGGSLIVGGAARTDLISAGMTETLTRAQFRTLQSAFTQLPDETLLYPTHGGGSFCSTGSGQQRASTLGQERRENPVLSISDEDDFVSWFPSTFPAAPAYFFRLRAFNQAGPRLRSEIPLPPALAPVDFALRRAGSVIVDTRTKEEYAKGHLPGSLSNPIRDDYAVWLGWLVPEDANLLFVTDSASIDRVVDQSLLVGYERFAGWLAGGTDVWERSGRELQRIDLVDADHARRLLKQGATVLDVRETDEFQSGHIEGALHLPLGNLPAEVARVPRDRPVIVYCGHGERASTGASILEAAGFPDLINLDGGISAWKAQGLPAVE